MHISFALLALAGSLSGDAAKASSPAWFTSYSQAQKVGRKEGRPLAVFIGSGQDGYCQVVRGGTFSPTIQKLLAQNYVCVHIDLAEPGAARLAEAFEISRSRGVVLSDRSGQFQAFRHNGELSEAELIRSLERFAKTPSASSGGRC